MAKYLINWEIDTTRVPSDAKKGATLALGMLEMVKADLKKKGFTKDWGAFPGGMKGYSIAEGSEEDLLNLTQQYTPFVKFDVCLVASVVQLEKAIKASISTHRVIADVHLKLRDVPSYSFKPR